jgi:biotin synthase
MRESFKEILTRDNYSHRDLVFLLSSTDKEENEQIYRYAYEIKKKYIGKKVHYRGLIEYSNICRKNCFYCGIRCGNDNTVRYTISNEEVFDAVDFAWKNHYGSIVLQAGERTDNDYTSHITYLLQEIKLRTNNEIGVTLSLGEQKEEIYQQWFDAGAHRYLLRIETTNRKLYEKIHPQNEYHVFGDRLNALKALKRIGYQVGTGVMIGLPDQTMDDLANDLLFFKNFGIDMCGMGPYIEHSDTPLFKEKYKLISKEQRLDLSLRMIALLRILMKDINIASTTALQSIQFDGREMALLAGANIIMPNITPQKYREDYLLYENKPCLDEDMEKCTSCLALRIKSIGEEIGYNEWGDSRHFKKAGT